ncbi:hypothetical protein QTP70_008332 [Hemibagrus guttatus]|uniref:Alkylated DNA repair protein AlkB homologue 8 N-terminal domain-containing protein n=1 Tax=Hemibagrus guttatus TaxID=175788 RepID=A0AAE0RJN2_9TELE|nr:hypothetical protein QTP70_008332 [Hemibagrus guttatus]
MAVVVNPGPRPIRCQILLENEISIFRKLVSRRKHEVLQNFLDSKDPPDCTLSESFTSPACTLGVDLRRGRRRFSGNLQLPPLSWRQTERSRTPDEEIICRPTTLPFIRPPRIDITPVDSECSMSSNELSAPDPEPCIRTFKEHMRLELEPPRLVTSPKVSPRSSPRLFRRLMVNKGGRHRRRFTVAHTCYRDDHGSVWAGREIAIEGYFEALLRDKLFQLNVPDSMCSWNTDFLTDRRQFERLGTHVSDLQHISTGFPQGCVLFPLLFSLYTNGCTSGHQSVKLLKFADDTTLIGLISDGDESFHFLGTTITKELKWEQNIRSLTKTAHQRMYFLQQLKKFLLPVEMLVNFYTAIIESILTSSITVWFAAATARDKAKLQRVIHSAEKIDGMAGLFYF